MMKHDDFDDDDFSTTASRTRNISRPSTRTTASLMTLRGRGTSSVESAKGDDGDGCDSRVSVLCHVFREVGVESLSEKMRPNGNFRLLF